MSAESITHLLPDHPVVLISADLPGCGASTLAEQLRDRLTQITDTEVFTIFVGKRLRQLLGVTNEAEMQAKLKEIKDPHGFDPQIYGELPADQACIVEGKLAVSAGPQFISADRPIVSINLSAPPLFSAKRTLEREGSSISVLFGEQPDGSIIDRVSAIGRRAAHDAILRSKIEHPAYTSGGDLPEANPRITQLDIDSSQFCAEELVCQLTGDTSYLEKAPEWETSALTSTLKTLMNVGVDLRSLMHPQDKIHYEHQLESITYGIDRLGMTLNADGLTQIRSDLKKAIIDCWYGLMMKRIPRFFTDTGTGETVFDTESHNWSPEFYKVAEGWPTLSTMLKDKVVLDPFAGAGTLMNLLVARGIPKYAFVSDISYSGGQHINSSNYWYEPNLNAQAGQLLFDSLPSWYKPDYSPAKGHVTADALALPFSDKSVDYIFGDPPYGKNLHSPGIGVLFGSLPEFGRVAREGSILLVPVDWVQEIRASGAQVRQLTGEVSAGKSNFPVCYIEIASPK